MAKERYEKIKDLLWSDNYELLMAKERYEKIKDLLWSDNYESEVESEEEGFLDPYYFSYGMHW